MSASDWIVIALGVAGIAWVNWYFFIAGRRTLATAMAAATATDATPEIVIQVEGGYAPSTVQVAAGRPVRLVFDRHDESNCSEEVVFPDFGIRKFLPNGQRTAIEVTPPRAGTYPFMCGMSMLRGRVIAA